MHHRFDPRCQLRNRLAHGLAEVVQFPPIHPPIEGSAHIGAGYAELDVVGFIGHRFLDTREPEARHRRTGGRTLIIVRRTATELKTALAGVMLEISFARFMNSISTFNPEVILS